MKNNMLIFFGRPIIGSLLQKCYRSKPPDVTYRTMWCVRQRLAYAFWVGRIFVFAPKGTFC